MTVRWTVRADPARAAGRGKSLLLGQNPTIVEIVGFFFTLYIFLEVCLYRAKCSYFIFIGYNIGYM